MQSQMRIKYNKTEFHEDSGITLLQFSNKYNSEFTLPKLAATVNGELTPMNEKLTEDCEVEFIDRTSDEGLRIYIRSLVLLFVRACKEISPNCEVSVEHSLNKGLYCEFKNESALSPKQVQKIEQKMRDIIALNEPFLCFETNVKDARKILVDFGFIDKANLLDYQKEDNVCLCNFGWLTDWSHGILAPYANCLDIFELKFYLPGLLIRFPTKESPDKLPDYVDSPKLYSVFRETENWAKKINVSNVYQLNRLIEAGKGNELIQISETLHEKNISAIADKISAQRQNFHVILIAGPSSSGKTTFAQRLRIHLMVNGMNPIPISIDNYYLNRESIPFDEEGKRDLESINTIDIELLNEHLSKLIQGQQVEIPFFNFKEGVREYKGNYITVNDNQPIIIEGIHGLNEQLTQMIPKRNKFKIYISALTQLNIDNHNRIPTTDTRLIRRIVRDVQFRGSSISATLSMWSSVRKGEEKYIFPFQELSDVMFNSALPYELAVLKSHINPLLESIKKNDPNFTEAKRLQKFLSYFVNIETSTIPANSILKEFIGGSCFHHNH